jgi:hypothetical protein
MATTAPAATGAASPAARAVAKGEAKAAARSVVGLRLPAQPPLPGLGLAAQGQTRAATVCECDSDATRWHL